MAMIATLHPVENSTPVNGHSIASIPLNKLTEWDGNVRKTGAEDGMEELTASIAAHGVLQSLVVRKAARGKYAIIAGRRRYRALSKLAERGTIAHDSPVPCRIVPGSSDATEIGLTENVQREPMHPADQFEAYRELVDKGQSPADIAARFGIREEAVKKILRLARVSPVVFEAYRKGELTLEQVQAFAVTDDTEAQERVFGEMLYQDLDPRQIRAALTQNDIAGTDKLARFVGVTAYEEAGGAVRRDLFSEGDKGVFLLDSQLLDRLAREKLEGEAGAIRAEGWKWVEIAPELDYEVYAGFKRLRPEPLPMTEEAQEEMRRLSEEYDALFNSAEDHDEESSERLDAIESRIEELQETGEAFSAETFGIAGAILTIGRDGQAEVHRGLVRPEDLPEETARADDTEPNERPRFSAALVESLTSCRSLAISVSLLSHPQVALASIVHALAEEVFGLYGEESSIQLTVNLPRLRESCESKDRLEAAYETWRQRIPEERGQLWNWCIAQSQDTLLELLAFCSAQLLDGVRRKGDREDCDRLMHAKALADAVQLDMKEWFTPTAENYFKRVGRDEVAKAITEAKGIPARRSWGKLKKADFAAFAEREVAGTGWLPEPLRA